MRQDIAVGSMKSCGLSIQSCHCSGGSRKQTVEEIHCEKMEIVGKPDHYSNSSQKYVDNFKYYLTEAFPFEKN
ncbi:hypothetical protein MPTK1_5g01990 [Marchantia polymorpha subsp. ruderalis]|uniref:Uncharacterized protein n=2 Tax=Marchantia polymorpha TaxID=3197 RepID=A0AAF6BDZ3_MARPO|nr:hypothetical protein MARPO_0161s0005 [Marchantia polymorpha]BBN10227.1 hypothetical protein Mp_5g01990 [Marchantia polymorpha subsp. ruderalis]|eukprot:PTQ28500.1 hypothetical protein MARPO_0161s0005 [Marchantia polymorpha]